MDGAPTLPATGLMAGMTVFHPAEKGRTSIEVRPIDIAKRRM